MLKLILDKYSDNYRFNKETMCRLFGFRSNVESRAHRSLIVAENAMANQARITLTVGGFAISLMRIHICSEPQRVLHKMIPFVDSEGLRSNTLLVHIRKATVGAIDPINSHPFRYGSWIFAHNGTIFAFDKIKELMGGDTPRISTCSVRHDRLRDHLLLTFSHGAQRVFPDGKCEVPIETLVEAQQEAINQIFEWVKEIGSRMLQNQLHLDQW